VIVGAVRTPVGRRNGALRGIHPVDLSARVLRALAERTGIDPGRVDDVIWGCVSQVGEQTYNVGRSAVLAAGWPCARISRNPAWFAYTVPFTFTSKTASHSLSMMSSAADRSCPRYGSPPRTNRLLKAYNH
jgi:hypothetical protein